MEKEKTAYIAGLFDADGSVPTPQRGGSIRSVVTNCHHDLLRWLQLEFGGKLYKKNRKKAHPRFCWDWSLYGKDALPFLEAILPYLITRYGQAFLALQSNTNELRDKIFDLNHGNISWGPIPSRDSLTEEGKVAYTAGFFDGEGCVTIAKARETTYWLQIRAGGTDLRTLIWLRDTFGGCIGKQKKYKAHHTQSWYWQLQGPHAEEFLREIKPYSVIKQRQINCGIRFREECAFQRGSHHLTKEQLDLRESFKQKLSALNFSKGRKAVAS